MRKIKIISDATPSGTKVIDADTGETIQDIVEVDVSIVGGGVPVARITFFAPLLDIVPARLQGRMVSTEYDSEEHG